MLDRCGDDGFGAFRGLAGVQNTRVLIAYLPG